jgi:acyl-homoserine-lactone acylase
MKKRVLLLLLFFAISCTQQQDKDGTTVIQWDSWGVPHVQAQSDDAFFFADGWAQMHAHANTLLRLYGTSRGRAAEYWGEEHLAGDIMVHTLDHPESAKRMWANQDPELRSLITAFVDGLNAYAEQHPEVIEETNRAVLPFTHLDVNLHSQFVVNTRFVARRELQISQHYAENGSNAFAVGPAKSASGHAMLVQNPHLPWSDEFLWFEKHAITPDRNIYGAHLVGLPGFAIAFNDHLGWTHTNNTIDNSDLYELTLEGEGYRFDGEIKAFETSSTTLRINDLEGGFSEKTVDVLRSVHGPVVSAGKEGALALRFVGTDANNALLQWWKMANARNFNEFEIALKMEQIPFWNVMYADKTGNIFYLFNGHVPLRSQGDWAYWQSTVPGDRSANLWTEIHPYSDLPRTLNPTTGWLQNANDPPWTSTIPAELDADDFPPYMSPRIMHFRPQRAATMMLEDDSVSFDELVEYKHDTRLQMADRILDDLYLAIDKHGSEIGLEAKRVLQDWDRKADNDSMGTVLFSQWAMGLNPYNPDIYDTAWEESAPVSTPDGLADPKAAVELLESVAQKMKDQYGRMDVAWGEVNRLNYNGHDLPANGANGALGVFRVAAAGQLNNGVQTVRHGDSWVAVIEFGETPRAKVLLSYGNSTQAGSPHFGDQLKLFSEKKMRDAWRTEEQFASHIVRIDRLPSGKVEPTP